jgi:predicted transcriptional regulator
MANPLPKPEAADPETEAFRAAVQEGIDDADAGRTVPYEDVRRWLLSWGTDRELSPPQRR